LKKMPHLIQSQYNGLRSYFRLWQALRLIAHPVQHRDITHTKNPTDTAETDIAHAIKQQRQRFLGRRLAARRSVGKIASAGFAKVALMPSHLLIFNVRSRLAAFATKIGHG
jgi:hypothetical protein